MNKTGLLIIINFFFLIFPCAHNVRAHGVEYDIIESKAISIRAGYDDGEPMNYAEVKIFSPFDATIEYQNGRTDKNGCFSFLPDKSGVWKIVIDDGMGHGVVTEIPVKDGIKIDSVHHGYPRWLKLVTGISIIFGLNGIYFYIRSRKQ